jgi:hypothetical protein
MVDFASLWTSNFVSLLVMVGFAAYQLRGGVLSPLLVAVPLLETFLQTFNYGFKWCLYVLIYVLCWLPPLKMAFTFGTKWYLIDRIRFRGSGTLSVILDFMYKTMQDAYNVWPIDAFVFFTFGRVSDRQNQYCINYVRMVCTIMRCYIKLCFVLTKKGIYHNITN